MEGGLLGGLLMIWLHPPQPRRQESRSMQTWPRAGTDPSLPFGYPDRQGCGSRTGSIRAEVSPHAPGPEGSQSP